MQVQCRWRTVEGYDLQHQLIANSPKISQHKLIRTSFLHHYIARWNFSMYVGSICVCVCLSVYLSVCLCIITFFCQLASVDSLGDIAIICSQQLGIVIISFLGKYVKKHWCYQVRLCRLSYTLLVSVTPMMQIRQVILTIAITMAAFRHGWIIIVN